MADAGWMWPVGLAILGVVFGSFIAVIVIRWPEGGSALEGRSRCDDCARTLAPIELIPVMSFVIQRGRCRSCGVAIDAMHPACEAIGLFIGLACGALMPGWEGVAGAIFGWLLLLLGALDLRAFWLPDIVTGLLALTGIASGLAGFAPSLEERLIGGLAGFVSLWCIAFAYRRLRGRHGLGGGDAKLLGAIGLWIGWRVLPLLVLTACLIGFVAVLFQMVRGRKVAATTAMPLGTMLAIAAFPLWLSGGPY
tara:strand:- start:283 stop:1035 length:753 start_codon:yes stop_codon:yes gene_type:complete